MGANLDQLRPFLGKAAGKDLQLYRLFDVNLAPGLTATFEVPFIPDKWAIAMAAVSGLSVAVQQRSQIDSGGISTRLYSGGNAELPGTDLYLSILNTGSIPALGTVFALAGADASVSPGIPASSAASATYVAGVQDAAIVGQITANGQTIVAPVGNRATATLSFHGVYAGVKFQVDGSDDGGTTWYATLPVVQEDTSAVTPGGSDITPGTNAQKTYSVECGGLTHIRVRSTAWTSGTAVVGITTTATIQPFIPSTDTAGYQKVAVGSSSGNVAIQGAGDGANLNGNGLFVYPISSLYNGATWDRIRTPAIIKDVPSVAVVAGTPAVIWTPASGKKFRLMGYALSLSVAGVIIFKYGAGPTTLFRTPAANASVASPPPPNFGNGIMPGAANDTLQVDVSASGNVIGAVWGTEE